MSAPAPCGACQMGNHERHVSHWMRVPAGPDLSAIFGASPVCVARVQCSHRIGLAYRHADGTLSLLPCDCNETTSVLEVVA